MYYLYLSSSETEWGEYETLTSNTIVREERPASGVVSFLSTDYKGDFYRKRCIYGTLSLDNIDGKCVLEILEGDERKHFVEYENEGFYDIDLEWEHYPGDGNTQVILRSEGVVYSAVLDYALYSKSSKLNYKLRKYGFYK